MLHGVAVCEALVESSERLFPLVPPASLPLDREPEVHGPTRSRFFAVFHEPFSRRLASGFECLETLCAKLFSRAAERWLSLAAVDNLPGLRSAR